MDRGLLWSALALGWAGWLCALLARGPRAVRPPGGLGIPPLHLVLAALLPPVAFLITLPSEPPFAAGHGLGAGFLIGGLSALLSTWCAAQHRGDTEEPLPAAAATAGPWFLAVAAVSLALLWVWHDSIDVLMGVAIGWVAVTAIVALGGEHGGGEARDSATRGASHPAEHGSRAAPHPVMRSPLHPFSLELSAGFVAALCAASGLAVYHGSAALDHVRWAASIVCFGAAIPLSLFVAALPAPILIRLALKLPGARMAARLSGQVLESSEARRTAVRAWRGALAAVVLLLLGWLISARVAAQPHMLHVIAIGLVAGFAAWWLSRDAAESTGPAPGALALLVLLAGAMAAYQMLAGLGVALAVTAAWLAGGMALSFEDEGAASSAAPAGLRVLAGALTFGAVAAVYRLTAARYADEVRGASLSDQYALFGIIVGAVLPGLASRLVERISLSPALQTFRLAIAGIVLLAAPALLVLLYGAKCALALLFGLSLAAAGQWAASSRGAAEPEATTGGRSEVTSPEDARSGAATRGDSRLTTRRSSLHPYGIVFSLASALAIAQWMRHVLPLASMTRAHKVDVVIGSLLVLGLMILVADYSGRIVTFRGGRSHLDVPEAGR